MNQLKTMLQLQDEINRKINHNWIELDRPWFRAVWLEAAEAVNDHCDWKWWKHGSDNREQIVLEVVDIAHFLWAQLIQDCGEIPQDEAVIGFARQMQGVLDSEQPMGIIEAFEALAHATLGSRSAELEAFARVMLAVGMSFDELYRSYVGKNILNRFRQDHGYKTGEYQKQWQGREDNEHLTELLLELDASRDSFSHDLYQGLASRYPK
ncbi:dUTP diphosphatase [Aestuariirhabdus litorea]|uniref:dUTP diphosphatase n=1 Tax=Aestuariirhabdus litorea TaxID=2528527 RepID=A0A3P3VS78_9GAMM|nr:dUTP diphosphatase [Aestuariirhabdus litorea]RRJ84828.1 dUTP diphosphatase [Aestuariirhabdus litorea]RWW98053.1 dUTP diphosphatase [Endozoicomonadaceae bacterium GTF-13]